MKVKTTVNNLLTKHGDETTQLLQILNGIQEQYHHIPQTAIDLLAPKLSVSPAHIISLIEFYNFLSLTPLGDYTILISDSITDQMLGNRGIIKQLCVQLGVELGKPREDGRVSVNTTSCTGMCDQGPAGLVNGFPLTSLDSQRIAEIVPLIEAATPITEWPEHLFTVDTNVQQRGMLLESDYTQGEAIRATFKRGRAKTLDELTIPNCVAVVVPALRQQ